MVWCPPRGWGRKMVGVGSATEYVECQAASENSRQDCTTAVLIFKMANDADRHNGFCWFGTAIGHRRQTARYKVFRACGSPAILHCQKYALNQKWLLSKEKWFPFLFLNKVRNCHLCNLIPTKTWHISMNLWLNYQVFYVKDFYFNECTFFNPFSFLNFLYIQWCSEWEPKTALLDSKT